MRVAQQILHRGARAISVAEFHDAIRSTCKPRFPEARALGTRSVGLAISGGVDSMALAFLCSQLHQSDRYVKISDHRISKLQGFVVDHKLREESSVEAMNVVRAIRNLGINGHIIPVNWETAFGKNIDLKSATNIESMARTVRYRLLGGSMSNMLLASLLVAHHEDDQYETVLMRLIAGHRNRTLRGIQKVASIPECAGIMGAYESGWIEGQAGLHPFFYTKIDKHQRSSLLSELRSSGSQRMHEGSPNKDLLAFLEHGRHDTQHRSKQVEHDLLAGRGAIPVEDGGITIYRPLLEFSKDRLIATCLENNVPWFEDGTNEDLALTMRNSIRHLHKSCKLPVALQKPRILMLAKRWQRRAEIQDAEAKRLLQRIVLHDFVPQAGTLVVQFPKVPALMSRRYTRTAQRFQRRISHRRLIAALAIRRIIALASPDLQVPTVANLQNVISRLFPGLAEVSGRLGASRPTAFNIGGLHFMPIQSTSPSVTSLERSHSHRWYISRQPYLTSAPLPSFRPKDWSSMIDDHGLPVPFSMLQDSHHLRWRFWDNRFWIGFKNRLPCRILVMPFLAEHAKAFRESLPPADRDRLALDLKKFAPGKVRYTLPAIYSEEYVDPANVVGRPGYPIPEDEYAKGVRSYPAGIRRPWPPLIISKMRLLALPTLGLQLPGLSDWVRYEARYKRADRETLQAMKRSGNNSFIIRRIVKLNKAKSTVGKKR